MEPISPTKWRLVLAQNARVHWRERHKVMVRDKEAVFWAAKAYRIEHPYEHATVSITLYVKVNRRRDAQILETCKGVLDGLVDAGIIADDSLDCIGVPTVRVLVDKELAYSYKVEVTEREQA